MSSVNQAVVDLVREVVEGKPPDASGTWFVQGGEALRETLLDLTAAEASMAFGANISTVAAHVIHAAYYLELAIDGMKGIERQGDWAGSWARQTVDDREWSESRARLFEHVQAFQNAVVNHDLAQDQNDLLYALANVGHLAYHLGAIRQLYQLAKSSRP